MRVIDHNDIHCVMVGCHGDVVECPDLGVCVCCALIMVCGQQLNHRCGVKWRQLGKELIS